MRTGWVRADTRSRRACSSVSKRKSSPRRRRCDLRRRWPRRRQPADREPPVQQPPVIPGRRGLPACDHREPPVQQPPVRAAVPAAVRAAVPAAEGASTAAARLHECLSGVRTATALTTAPRRSRHAAPSPGGGWGGWGDPRGLPARASRWPPRLRCRRSRRVNALMRPTRCAGCISLRWILLSASLSAPLSAPLGAPLMTSLMTHLMTSVSMFAGGVGDGGAARGMAQGGGDGRHSWPAASGAGVCDDWH